MFRQNLNAVAFGEPEVVLGQRLTAPTLQPTMQAPQRVHPVNPGPPASGWVGTLAFSRLSPEEDSGRCTGDGLLSAKVAPHIPDPLLVHGDRTDGADTQHPFGGVVVRLQAVAPVAQFTPLRRVETPSLRGTAPAIDQAAAMAPLWEGRAMWRNTYAHDPCLQA